MIEVALEHRERLVEPCDFEVVGVGKTISLTVTPAGASSVRRSESASDRAACSTGRGSLRAATTCNADAYRARQAVAVPSTSGVSSARGRRSCADSGGTDHAKDAQGYRADAKAAFLRVPSCIHQLASSGIAPGGSAATIGSTEPFTGGRSWNMKSHFQRSDGFDACSQCFAATGRANASAGDALRACDAVHPARRCPRASAAASV